MRSEVTLPVQVTDGTKVTQKFHLLAVLEEELWIGLVVVWATHLHELCSLVGVDFRQHDVGQDALLPT